MAELLSAKDQPRENVLMDQAAITNGEMNAQKTTKTQSIYCEICGFSLNSESQAQAHFAGRIHLNRLQLGGHGAPQGGPGAPQGILKMPQLSKQKSISDQCNYQDDG